MLQGFMLLFGEQRARLLNILNLYINYDIMES